MEKKDLVKLLDEIFIPIGFKRKGNNWIFNSDELSKTINLQKSNYGNSFYINYGYIIKNLELTTTTHVGNRLASTEKEQQKRITDLLDLENSIDREDRLSELKMFVCDNILSEFTSTNTKKDLLNELKKRPHLNNIPLVVKKHFNLAE